MSQGVARGHVAEDRKFAVNCKSGRSVVRVRSIEGELQQHAAAGLDDPPTVLSYLRFDEGAQMVLELDVRPFFIQPSQSAVAGHISRQDSGESSFYPLRGQGCSSHL